ncbi:hypothetical protein ACN9MH_15195 [Paenibacillus silvae]|uniref:hypothetical protein n=1 Tax=Paenibacillus silvae TaxID=1325358 RepID=UPI003CEAA4D7
MSGKPIQLDLFSTILTQPKSPKPRVLNGMYYERSSGLFVSYVQGRRHFEVTPARCLGDKAWKEKTMRERAI